jgi:hypothetical protein
MSSVTRTSLIAGGLVIIGCTQLLGDLTGLLPLKALGAASHASPAAKVFTAHDGLETFSATFHISYYKADGIARTIELTPALNKRLRGPYNRRNTFGAAIAGAPILHQSDLLRPMHDATLRHAFCSKKTMLAELGVKDARGPFTLDIKLNRAPQSPRAWKLQYEVTCDAQ